jgi:TPR repeat protein
MKWKSIWVVGALLLAGSWVQAQVTEAQARAWAGDSVAMLQLSEAYRFGNGVEKNEDSAKIYIQKSAAKGHTEAQFLYGTELMIDVFTASTYAKGVALLKKAAEKGNVDAQYRLAEVHCSKGRNNVSDTYYDLKKAYLYGEMAAAQGLPEALMFCAEARLKGSGTTKSDSIAIVYFRRAADEKNYVPGIIRMGNMYWEGKVTGKAEPYIAKEWFERALAQKHANLDQRGKADEGIYYIDQFFKRIQNTFLDANPGMPMGMFDYRLR